MPISLTSGMLLVATMLFLIESSMQQWMLFKYHVHIVNELPSGSPMEVHCKSGDDDLMDHTVEAGHEYNFTFRENFWMTTLFWCDVWWVSDNRHTSGKVFWPIDAFMGRCRNRQCFWNATGSGLEFKNPYTNATLFTYHWN